MNCEDNRKGISSNLEFGCDNAITELFSRPYEPQYINTSCSNFSFVQASEGKRDSGLCGDACSIGGSGRKFGEELASPSQKSAHAFKVDENTSAGVLRYALHLRFLCPYARKGSRSMQRCKSDAFSQPYGNSNDSEGERRFYLYNDLRVVFPQRHTDADEGKVCF